MNTFKYRVFPPFGRFQLEICQLPKPGDRSNFNTHKTCWKCCYNNERPTGQKQLLDGRTVENKGKLILFEIQHYCIQSHRHLILITCLLWFHETHAGILIDRDLSRAVSYKFERNSEIIYQDEIITLLLELCFRFCFS